LRNSLALLGWSTGDGVTEILSDAEMIKQFSFDHVTKSPAVFDLEKLNWLNRHYLKESPPARLAELAFPFLTGAGYLAEPSNPAVLHWVGNVVNAVLKNLDSLSQLPDATRVIFNYDAASIVHGEETRHVVEEAASREVLAAFVPKVLAESEVTYERFREIAKTVQKETGKKGKDLFHPIRVAVTGAVSGPELEKLIPIFEEGAKLSLAHPVKNSAQRLHEFAQAAGL